MVWRSSPPRTAIAITEALQISLMIDRALPIFVVDHSPIVWFSTGYPTIGATTIFPSSITRAQDGCQALSFVRGRLSVARLRHGRVQNARLILASRDFRYSTIQDLAL